MFFLPLVRERGRLRTDRNSHEMPGTAVTLDSFLFAYFGNGYSGFSGF
jgi:hypothetical protein